jgi:hypothetical protein
VNSFDGDTLGYNSCDTMGDYQVSGGICRLYRFIWGVNPQTKTQVFAELNTPNSGHLCSTDMY